MNIAEPDEPLFPERDEARRQLAARYPTLEGRLAYLREFQKQFADRLITREMLRERQRSEEAAD